MKIKFKQKSRSLVKLHLLKYQMYKNSFNTSLNNVNIELKQALKVIYLYNTKKKKILFIGFPFNIKLQNQIKQIFMSKIGFKKELLNNSAYILGSKGKKPDLIVFNGISSDDFMITKELKKFNTPLILFGNYNQDSSFKTYNVKVCLDKNYIKKFCWFLIFSILTKKK